MGRDGFNWKACDDKTANALLSGSTEPGKLWKFDAQFLPGNIVTSMAKRGPVKFYVSGSLSPAALPEGVTGLGEMAAVRHEKGEAIPYRWIFALSGSGAEQKMYYGAFFKDFDPRHITGSYNVEDIFRDPHPDWPSP